MQAGRYSQHTQQRIGIQTTKDTNKEKTNHSTEKWVRRKQTTQQKNGSSIHMNEIKGASLVVQWSRICPPVQETRFNP